MKTFSKKLIFNKLNILELNDANIYSIVGGSDIINIEEMKKSLSDCTKSTQPETDVN